MGSSGAQRSAATAVVERARRGISDFIARSLLSCRYSKDVSLCQKKFDPSKGEALRDAGLSRGLFLRISRRKKPLLNLCDLRVLFFSLC